MAAYIDKSDCLIRITLQELIRLCADKEKPTDPEPEIVDEKILAALANAATEEVNGYLRRHYRVPLSGTIPEIVKQKTVSVFLYHAHMRRRTMPEATGEDYKRTVKWLEDVSKGIVDLGIEPQPAGNANRQIETFGDERVMTEERLSGLL